MALPFALIFRIKWATVAWNAPSCADGCSFVRIGKQTENWQSDPEHPPTLKDLEQSLAKQSGWKNLQVRSAQSKEKNLELNLFLVRCTSCKTGAARPREARPWAALQRPPYNQMRNSSSMSRPLPNGCGREAKFPNLWTDTRTWRRHPPTDLRSPFPVAAAPPSTDASRVPGRTAADRRR